MEVDPVVVAMIPGGVAGFTALWYKMGRVESKLDAHLNEHHIGGHDDRVLTLPQARKARSDRWWRRTRSSGGADDRGTITG